MVLKKELPLKTIVDGLALLRTACEDRAKLGLLDLHILAESFFCRFLNEVYGLNLRVLKVGHAAIDLGDDQAGVAYQVTTDSSKAKVQDTLDTYAANKLVSTYPSIKVLVIGVRRPIYKLAIPKGVTFDPKVDVLDVQTLGAEISKLGTLRIGPIADIMREEIVNTDIRARATKPSVSLEVSLNGQILKLPETTCTYAPDAGWGLDLVLHNTSGEVLESGDFSVAFAIPLRIHIEYDSSTADPAYKEPLLLRPAVALYEMIQFNRLLPGARARYAVVIRVNEDEPYEVVDTIEIEVYVHTKTGKTEYPVKLTVVGSDENLAAIQRRPPKPSPALKAAILQMHSFVRTVEEGGKKLPPVSWKRTFGQIDPECENLTKKEMIDRLFAETNRGTLVVYLGAVKGIYVGRMQNRDIQAKYRAVCQAFGVSFDELV